MLQSVLMNWMPRLLELAAMREALANGKGPCTINKPPTGTEFNGLPDEVLAARLKREETLRHLAAVSEPLTKLAGPVRKPIEYPSLDTVPNFSFTDTKEVTELLDKQLVLTRLADTKVAFSLDRASVDIAYDVDGLRSSEKSPVTQKDLIDIFDRTADVRGPEQLALSPVTLENHEGRFMVSIKGKDFLVEQFTDSSNQRFLAVQRVEKLSSRGFIERKPSPGYTYTDQPGVSYRPTPFVAPISKTAIFRLDQVPESSFSSKLCTRLLTSYNGFKASEPAASYGPILPRRVFANNTYVDAFGSKLYSRDRNTGGKLPSLEVQDLTNLLAQTLEITAKSDGVQSYGKPEQPFGYDYILQSKDGKQYQVSLRVSTNTKTLNKDYAEAFGASQLEPRLIIQEIDADGHALSKALSCKIELDLVNPCMGKPDGFLFEIYQDLHEIIGLISFQTK